MNVNYTDGHQYGTTNKQGDDIQLSILLIYGSLHQLYRIRNSKPGDLSGRQMG